MLAHFVFARGCSLMSGEFQKVQQIKKLKYSSVTLLKIRGLLTLEIFCNYKLCLNVELKD